METCNKCGENTDYYEYIYKDRYEVIVCEDCYAEYLQLDAEDRNDAWENR